MQFRPCIDILNGKVTQIVGETLATNSLVAENFVTNKNAAYFADLYKKNNLAGGHIIMLDKTEKTKSQTIEALKTFPQDFQVGGNINSDNAQEFINAGASHIIVTSYIFKDNKLSPLRLQRLMSAVKKEKIVLDLSCRKKNNEYYVVTNRWQIFSNFKVTSKNLETLSNYCDEFLIHGVDSEGKLQGVEIDLLNILKDFTGIPITYAGGIRDMNDIEKIKQTGNGYINFSVGTALDIFGGELNYNKVIEKYAN
ncbi:phosphoribosylformimino-5-aminoimidazole carboxamide ribotide isomerase [bacterium]|jgi:phosphoribosylformimino-5-aminoimidazole carboxamide ribotide isomerase|nr:phosphoribosylformimino-5-aminoimidazole carboxamide ribotide isomerase [Candidatus Parcubacteria bacterium]MBT7087466.1 phosphoribosylformimino-5-aminoimidazole carboxamide ribotide isomerase [bacterium]